MHRATSRFIRPPAIEPGSTLAAVSLSWGGPHSFPAIFRNGIRQLEELLSVEIIPSTHALRDAEWLRRNPRARAEDLLEALEDRAISGIISSIGGSDSIRITPFIPAGIIARTPKVFLGFSDSTVTQFLYVRDEVVSFSGPAIMAPLGEVGGILPYTARSLKAMLQGTESLSVTANGEYWLNEFHDFESASRPRTRHDPVPWRVVNGSGSFSGAAIGGCIEVLQFLFGTPLWPLGEFWNGKILFIETSEEALPADGVRRILRTLARQGVLSRISGVLFGRPGGPKLVAADFDAYDDALRTVIVEEEGLESLPILTRLDFGHTDPVFTVPLGMECTIDLDVPSITWKESPVCRAST